MQLPRHRRDFRVAILCALPLEASAIIYSFDKLWDDRIFGKASSDSNAYSTGVIGDHNVVLVHVPGGGGKVAAATAATNLLTSFQEIQLALVVGICGATPTEKQEGKNIFLGDVVISEGLLQYDFGRKFPKNRFVLKDATRTCSDRICGVLAKLKTEQGRSGLQDKTSEYIGTLKQKDVVRYPGATEDRLFKSTCSHKHQTPSECAICSNNDGGDDICDKAIRTSCQGLKCEPELRARPTQSSNPGVHFGLVASGDTVMRSGEDRDGIAARDGVIAFEMEGAGVWGKFNHSLVIKGVCDYADSHKDKKWQGYAAATAAAATKAFLENWNTGMHTHVTCSGGRVLNISDSQRHRTSSNTTTSRRQN